MSDIISKGISGIQYLFGRQVAGKLIPFILNIFMIRHLAPTVVGVANVQLQLILSVVSILSRDCFRRACLRQKDVNSQIAIMKTINTSWLVIPLGVLVSTLVTYSFFWSAQFNVEKLKYFKEALIITGVASVIELISEPPYILAQNELLYKVRMYIETVGLTLRCVITYFCVTVLNFEILSFGIGHLAYSLCLILGYYGYFIAVIRTPQNNPQPRTFTALTQISQLFPHTHPGQNWLDKGVISLVVNFEWQSLQKLILQEGEKIVLTYSSSLYDQGVYSVVYNLGSLVARFIFLTVEEVTFSIFSKLLSAAPNADTRREALHLFSVLFKFMLYIGVYFVTLGPAFSFLVIDILYGSKYSISSEAPDVLWYFFFYVLIMGVNGIVEAFVHAVAPEHQLRTFNFQMIVLAVFYMLLATLLLRLGGTVGLVISNCINMIIRIAVHGQYIVSYFKDTPRVRGTSALPSPYVLLGCLLVFMITNYSSSILCDPSTFGGDPSSTLIGLLWRLFPGKCIYHVVFGLVCFLFVTALIYIFEKPFLFAAVKLWKERR